MHKKLLNHLGKYFVVLHPSCSSYALVNIAKNLHVDQTVLWFNCEIECWWKYITILTENITYKIRKWVERFEKILEGWGKFFVCLALVVWRLDNAIHWINLYLVDSAECFTITYLLYSNSSNG